MKRLLILWLLVTLLPACAMISDYLAGDDNTDPPTPLKNLENPLAMAARWTAKAGDGTDDQFVKLVPAVFDGKVYTADQKGRVMAFNSATGARVWESDTKAAIAAGPGVGDELVLLGTSDGEVIALERDSGAQRWRVQVNSEVLAVPRADRGVVAVQTVAGNLIGLDAADGKRRWIHDYSVPVLSLRGTSSPVLAQGAVISGFASGKLSAVLLDDGRVVWETSVAMPSGRSELERLVDLDADPVVADGIVYAVTFQGRLAAIELGSGRALWSRDMSSATGLAVAGKQIFLTDDNGNLWALDRSNGASLWKQDDLVARSVTAPVIFGDYVAVADFEGYVHLISQADGHIAARTRVDDRGILAPPTVVGDTLFALGRGGRLAAYLLP